MYVSFICVANFVDTEFVEFLCRSRKDEDASGARMDGTSNQIVFRIGRQQPTTEDLW